MTFDPTRPPNDDARTEEPRIRGRDDRESQAGRWAKGILGTMAGIGGIVLLGLVVLIILVIVL